MTDPNPITQFMTAVERATARGVDTTPVALATADADGRPSVRMVLLRGVDERGFVFHTNYKSRKARELDRQPLRRAVLPLAHARGADSHRGRGRAPAGRRVRRLLRADARAEASSARGPRRKARSWTSRETFDAEYARDRSALRRPASPPPAILGRLPHRPVAHRVLVRTDRPAARSDSVHARRGDLDRSETVSVSWFRGSAQSSTGSGASAGFRVRQFLLDGSAA